jgi:hypothetical protein
MAVLPPRMREERTPNEAAFRKYRTNIRVK